ncbi:MAG: ABC transporter permease [Candidatus Magasanikbacteria bacterium]|nr:ABC transporter permease [Candidatus Magasanikbacteria bacterium]
MTTNSVEKKSVSVQKEDKKQHISRRMVVKDILSLSTRTFKTRPMRTALTILGMSVGIGAVLFLVSLGYGLQETVLNRITNADALLSLDVSAGQSELIKLDRAHLDKMAQLPNVEEVSPITAISSQITLKDLTGIVTLYSVKPSFFRLSGILPFKGKLFEGTQSGETKREIVVSSALATIFNLDPDSIIGETVSITAFVSRLDETGAEVVSTTIITDPFVIVGVVQDDKESFMYSPESLLQDIHVETYIGAKIKVTSPEVMGAIRDQVIDMGFFVSALQDTIDQVKKIFSIVQIVLGLFGLVALIVSAIGMFNTMTVLLMERTNEIGIMRSIGVTRNDVRKLFMVEAMVMGFLGGLGGVALGHLGGVLANFGINLLAKNFGGQALSLFSRPASFIVGIIIFSTIIGFITGIFPAQRAAKIKPLDALRYK